jgi:hypothetical protein
VTRNATKTSTKVTVAATEAIQPKQLNNTFQSMDHGNDKDVKDKDNANEDSNAEDSNEDTSLHALMIRMIRIHLHLTRNKPLYMNSKKSQQTTTKIFITTTKTPATKINKGSPRKPPTSPAMTRIAARTTYNPAQPNPYVKKPLPKNMEVIIQDSSSDKELEIPTPDNDNTDAFTPVQRKNNRNNSNQNQRHVTMDTPEETDAADDTMMADIPTTPGEPETIDIQRECRYSVIVSVPPSTKPWKAFSDLLRKFLKIYSRTDHKKLHIAPWDPELAEVGNRKKYATYFSGYPN